MVQCLLLTANTARHSPMAIHRAPVVNFMTCEHKSNANWLTMTVWTRRILSAPAELYHWHISSKYKENRWLYHYYIVVFSQLYFTIAALFVIQLNFKVLQWIASLILKTLIIVILQCLSKSDINVQLPTILTSLLVSFHLQF